MRPVHQTITACPIRRDGHDAEGNPGNCFQAAVASLLELDLHEVPHFARHHSWWFTLRRWARERGGDFTWYPTNDDAYPGLPVPESWAPTGYVIAGGPSPRGPFQHVVITDLAGNLVHDPHPSSAGLPEVLEVYLYVAPYLPGPEQLALPRAA